MLLSIVELVLLHMLFRRRAAGSVTDYSRIGAASHVVQKKGSWFVTECSRIGAASHVVEEKDSWFCC